MRTASKSIDLIDDIRIPRRPWDERPQHGYEAEVGNFLAKTQTNIECFHSRGQHLCKFIGTKESVCIRKEFNSHRTGLGHQHGRRFIVLGHQYGRCDVMWKRNWLVAAESLENDRNQQKTVRFQSWNLTGKLKGYLFRKTKLWEELVVLKVKFKKPRSQKKKQEVFKKMVYCVKMWILEFFLYNFILLLILFLLCVSVVWS